jgi:DNA replication protein DnaC
MKIRKLNKDLLKDAAIPKKFWPLGAKTYFGDHAALQKADNYVSKFSKAYSEGVGLFVTGAPYTLKTFLLTYILKCLMHEGYSTLYCTLDELYEYYMQEESAGAGFLARFKSPECIVLDNVNAPFGKGVRNALIKVVTFRSDNGLPYLIGSTLNNDEIKNLYGDRIAVHFDSDLYEVPCSVDPEILRTVLEKKKEFLC